MFGRISTFLFGCVAGGLFVFGALKYHLIKADDGMHLVPKMGATFQETYLDVRGFGAGDWSEHAEVAAALVRADKGYLITDAGIDSLFGGAEDLLHSMNR